MPPARSPILGALIVVLSAAMFGTLGVASRFAYDQGLEPFALVAWRAGVGAIGLWTAILLIRRPRSIRAGFGRLDGTGRRWLVGAMVLGTALNLAAFLSFDHTTVALALLGFYTYPALVAAGAVALGRERLDAGKVVALLMSIGGMAAVVLGGNGETAAPGNNALGIVLAFAASLFQTAFILTSRSYARLPADQAMGSVLAGSAVVALAISIVTVGPAALALPLRSPPLLTLLVLVGLFAAALPSVMFLTGIRWIGGVRTGILMLFEPVVGVALAAVLLAEGLTIVQALGGVTILAAALIVQRGSRSGGETDLDREGISEAVVVMPAPGGP
ncbi:MAG TPA: DMT family transporter [Candidatus Limnocylindria bacterium]|nr:DMT family transporter [Candidatus Limnocylindria bacterium]